MVCCVVSCCCFFYLCSFLSNAHAGCAEYGGRHRERETNTHRTDREIHTTKTIWVVCLFYSPKANASHQREIGTLEMKQKNWKERNVFTPKIPSAFFAHLSPSHPKSRCISFLFYVELFSLLFVRLLSNSTNFASIHFYCFDILRLIEANSIIIYLDFFLLYYIDIFQFPFLYSLFGDDFVLLMFHWTLQRGWQSTAITKQKKRILSTLKLNGKKERNNFFPFCFFVERKSILCCSRQILLHRKLLKRWFFWKKFLFC